MKVHHLYSGRLSYFDRCEENHNFNCPGERFFYTELSPSSDYEWVRCYDLDFYREQDGKTKENYPFNAPETSIRNVWNMLHNMFVGFSLMPKDADIIVRNRTDIILSGPCNYEQYDVSERAVFIPSGNDYWTGINDQFAFGNPEVMRDYFKLYLSMQKYYDEGCRFHPESLLKYHLDRQGIKIVRLPITNRKNE